MTPEAFEPKFEEAVPNLIKVCCKLYHKARLYILDYRTVKLLHWYLTTVRSLKPAKAISVQCFLHLDEIYEGIGS